MAQGPLKQSTISFITIRYFEKQLQIGGAYAIDLPLSLLNSHLSSMI